MNGGQGSMMGITARRAVAVLVCCTPAPALAGGAATDAYDDVDPTVAVDGLGFGDLYLAHNFNDPVSGRNQLREFDFNADRASLGYARLTLAHRPERLGFRLDVGAGDVAEVYDAQDPASASHPTVARTLSYVEQAFLTVRVPVDRALQVDLGKFTTPMGFEDNKSLTNWSYSRSLLYSWAEPSLHTGLRVTSRLTNGVAASLFWVNGWNSIVIDGSDMRTFAGAVSWTPADGLAVVAANMTGLEHPPTRPTAALSLRTLVATYVLYQPAKPLALALAADYGHDRVDRGADWWGAAGYARFETLPWLAVAVRGELFADPSGFMTGTSQRVAEATTTLEVHGSARRLRVLARLEYRHDQSSAQVFETGTPASRNRQDTLTLALLAAFRSSDRPPSERRSGLP